MTALIIPMAGGLGTGRPNVSLQFPSKVGPQVVGPLLLRLIVLSLFLRWGLAHQARPFFLLPPSSGGGGAPDGGVAPVPVPDGGPCLSVGDDSSAASNVLNSDSHIISNENNAVSNANNIDNAISKVSNVSNVSLGSASSKVAIVLFVL